MNKIQAMREHVAARRAIGIPLSKLQAIRGYVQMFFTVQKATIIGATRSLRNGSVKYDSDRKVLYRACIDVSDKL